MLLLPNANHKDLWICRDCPRRVKLLNTPSVGELAFQEGASCSEYGKRLRATRSNHLKSFLPDVKRKSSVETGRHGLKIEKQWSTPELNAQI